MDNQLQEIIELQREQNQLLKQHLTRIRFSLWALLLLTTLTAIGLGIGVYLLRPASGPVIVPVAPQPNSFRPMPPPALPPGYRPPSIQYDTPPTTGEKPPVG